MLNFSWGGRGAWLKGVTFLLQLCSVWKQYGWNRGSKLPQHCDAVEGSNRGDVHLNLSDNVYDKSWKNSA